MSASTILSIATVVCIIVRIIHKLMARRKVPPMPNLEATWWGRRKEEDEDTTIHPFRISISDEVLQDLRYRLNNARLLTPPLEDTQHQYGINTNLLNKIVHFWRTKYNWREREAFLNRFPQYTVSVQGLRIHYLHVKPENSIGLEKVPLLLLHGWPGSVREFFDIIPLLTKPQPGRDFIFEVIAPSLPGYGFSEAAVKPGLGAVEMALLFKNFMNRLGFEKYYIQGGDWGAVIIQNMATMFPKEVLGLHSNMCVVNSPMANVKLFFYSFYPTLILQQQYVNQVYPLSRRYANLVLESGYMHLQATKPDTVGVSLNDSPVGLAAYILEKFITWTNPEWKNLEDGGLTKKYTYTDLLDNVMIYWVTNSITTSMRLYAETLNKKQQAIGISKIPVLVPAAVARFIHDLQYTPDTLIRDKYYNLVQVTDYEGGHFAAFEEPEILAEDIYNGMEKIRLFHKNSTK